MKPVAHSSRDSSWSSSSRLASGASVRIAGDTQAGDAIRVDFQVIGAEGQPIADLKADEVAIRVGGRARSIKELQFVKVPGAGGGAAPAAVPAPFGTNAGGGGEGRQVALVIEDETLPPGGERNLREAIGAVPRQARPHRSRRAGDCAARQRAARLFGRPRPRAGSALAPAGPREGRGHRRGGNLPHARHARNAARADGGDGRRRVADDRAVLFVEIVDARRGAGPVLGRRSV